VLETDSRDGGPSTNPDRQHFEAKLTSHEQISRFSSDFKGYPRTANGIQRPEAGNARGSDTLRILLAASLIVVPIVSFTITILWIVFTRRVGNAQCPFLEICPGPELVNTTSTSDYFIDFPAARLAFVSSLSSTISFTLVSAMMAMYAYSAARQLFRLSNVNSNVQQLPSPDQLSVLLRMLNADVLAFWDVVSRKVTRVFWHGEATPDPHEEKRTPSILRDVILVFNLALLSRYATFYLGFCLANVSVR
jgi:hypothetical protein